MTAASPVRREDTRSATREIGYRARSAYLARAHARACDTHTHTHIHMFSPRGEGTSSQECADTRHPVPSRLSPTPPAFDKGVDRFSHFSPPPFLILFVSFVFVVRVSFTMKWRDVL